MDAPEVDGEGDISVADEAILHESISIAESVEVADEVDAAAEEEEDPLAALRQQQVPSRVVNHEDSVEDDVAISIDADDALVDMEIGETSVTDDVQVAEEASGDGAPAGSL